MNLFKLSNSFQVYETVYKKLDFELNNCTFYSIEMEFRDVIKTRIPPSAFLDQPFFGWSCQTPHPFHFLFYFYFFILYLTGKIIPPHLWVFPPNLGGLILCVEIINYDFCFLIFSVCFLPFYFSCFNF